MENIHARQATRLRQLEDVKMIPLQVNRTAGKNYYYSKKRKTISNSNGEKLHKVEIKYLGNASEKEVNDIKEARYLELSQQIIENNISLVNKVIKELKPFNYSSINNNLPKTYRGAYLSNQTTANKKRDKWLRESQELKSRYVPPHPENLKYKTIDGSYVRSKSEVIIYNILTSLGFTFAYERPLQTDRGIMWPDFTILSEIDNESIIIIEHQGMIDDEQYRSHHVDRVYEYLQAGFIPLENIFYTYDCPQIGFDTSIIQDILQLRVRPDL